MNKVLRHPATNAIGISVFSLFYGIIFLGFSNLLKLQTGQSESAVWKVWDAFLLADGHKYAACILLTLTAAVVGLLLFKHKPYDEYHTGILIKCLALSVILILAAIGLFFIIVLADPIGIISKLALFIMSNWALSIAVYQGWVLKLKTINPAIPYVSAVLIILAFFVAIETILSMTSDKKAPAKA